MERWGELGPIRWGFDDCVPLVADEISRLAGFDPVEPLRFPDGGLFYRTREQRDQCVRETGGTILRMILRGIRRRGYQPVEPDKAPIHSIGLAAPTGTWALGMNIGDGWWVFRADFGAHVLPTEQVRRAWVWQCTG